MVECPWHDDDNPSLYLDFRSGAYFCHGCGVYGPDIVSYQSRRVDGDFHTCMLQMESWLSGQSWRYRVTGYGYLESIG